MTQNAEKGRVIKVRLVQPRRGRSFYLVKTQGVERPIGCVEHSPAGWWRAADQHHYPLGDHSSRRDAVEAVRSAYEWPMIR